MINELPITIVYTILIAILPTISTILSLVYIIYIRAKYDSLQATYNKLLDYAIDLKKGVNNDIH